MLLLFYIVLFAGGGIEMISLYHWFAWFRQEYLLSFIGYRASKVRGLIFHGFHVSTTNYAEFIQIFLVMVRTSLILIFSVLLIIVIV